MTISDFSLKMVLLFLPGIVSFVIIDNMSSHRQTKNTHWFIYPLLLGLLSYAILKFFWPGVQIWDFLISHDPQINYSEIMHAIITGFFLGCAITYMINHSIFFKVFSFIRLTNRQGTPDTLSYMSSLYQAKYLIVTDWEKRIRIVGELVATSESTDYRDEIVLQDATLYALETGEKLYEVPVIYLAQSFEKITIEIANTQDEGDDSHENTVE